MDDLFFMKALGKELLEAGKIIPVIYCYYPFAETNEAIRYLETGWALGKIVIKIAENINTM